MGPEVMVFLVPISAIVMGIGAGIIGMLTKHQQRMAEIVNQPRQSDDLLVKEIRALRSEVADLRDRVNQSVIEKDALSGLDTEALRHSPPPFTREQEDALRSRNG